MLNFYWVRYLFSFPLLDLPHLTAFVAGFIYGEYTNSNPWTYAFASLVVCLPFTLLWEAYINPWYAAMLYVIWYFGCAGNPLAMILHVIKAYVGLVLYTVGLVITPVVMAFGQVLEDEAFTKQDLSTIVVGVVFSCFFIYQRRWILHVRGVLPWPKFSGSDEDFQYLPRKNLPELRDRPFGLF